MGLLYRKNRKMAEQEAELIVEDKVECSEQSLVNYLSCKSTKAQVYVPYTAGKYQKKRFQKVLCPITERFVNQLMVGNSRQNGKKQMAVRIFRQTMDSSSHRTKPTFYSLRGYRPRRSQRGLHQNWFRWYRQKT